MLEQGPGLRGSLRPPCIERHAHLTRLDLVLDDGAGASDSGACSPCTGASPRPIAVDIPMPRNITRRPPSKRPSLVELLGEHRERSHGGVPVLLASPRPMGSHNLDAPPFPRRPTPQAANPCRPPHAAAPAWGWQACTCTCQGAAAPTARAPRPAGARPLGAWPRALQRQECCCHPMWTRAAPAPARPAPHLPRPGCHPRSASLGSPLAA